VIWCGCRRPTCFVKNGLRPGTFLDKTESSTADNSSWPPGDRLQRRHPHPGGTLKKTQRPRPMPTATIYLATIHGRSIPRLARPSSRAVQQVDTSLAMADRLAKPTAPSSFSPTCRCLPVDELRAVPSMPGVGQPASKPFCWKTFVAYTISPPTSPSRYQLKVALCGLEFLPS